MTDGSRKTDRIPIPYERGSDGVFRPVRSLLPGGTLFDRIDQGLGTPVQQEEALAHPPRPSSALVRRAKAHPALGHRWHPPRRGVVKEEEHEITRTEEQRSDGFEVRISLRFWDRKRTRYE